MDDAVQIALLTLMAGGAMPVGASLACIDSLYPRWLTDESRHGIIAFGGGALVSAIALVLVPEGIEPLSTPVASICFLAGGICFLWLDIILDRLKSPAGQLAAMLSDFIPEATAMGASFASGSDTVMLLSAMIAIQNLPEGFNAYREMTSSGKISGKRVITGFLAMSLLGPCAGLCGYFLLAPHPQVIAGIMLFAGGGILYLVFQDIAPDSKLQRKWLPAFGAVVGFLLGMVGKMIV